MLRITKTEELILEMLLRKSGGESYGLELVAESGGRVARGSVYVLLDRLEDKGLAQSRLEDEDAHRPGMRRRLYRITGRGQRVLDAWQLARAHLMEAMS